MTHLYLICVADPNSFWVSGEFYKRDQGLSLEGIKQVLVLRDRLANTGEIKPDVFFSSTSASASETAMHIEPALGQPILLDEDLDDWRYGDARFIHEAFMEQWRQVPDAQKPYYRWGQGSENWMEFSLRVHLVLNGILQHYEGKIIVIVTHREVIQLSFAYFFGFDGANLLLAAPEIRNTSITHWYKSEAQSRWILGRFDDCQHC